MERQLMILEVSRKQDYIFAPKRLLENRQRSAQIDYVTSREFFVEICPEEFQEEEHLVYTGGGHTVLQFPHKADADRFARVISKCVLEDFPDMELFIKQLPYDASKTPGENLSALSRALEDKKARHASSFRTLRFGPEVPGVHVGKRIKEADSCVPPGWVLTEDLSKIQGEDNFLAVIHIDGNAMGTRVQHIYESCKNDWDACIQKLRLFSEEIKDHFSWAYDEMTKELVNALEKGQTAASYNGYLPLRKVIGAGDDVCFVTAGKLGLECAASFLRHLSKKRNLADQKGYSACAGVVLIHAKFPFRRAYDLSEALCKNAKLFAAKQGGHVSAIDYHIEFGQMKGSLSQIRQDYRTDDGNYLELRPLVVVGDAPIERQYRFLTTLIRKMNANHEDDHKDNREDFARSKVKSLRTALRQGEIEAKLAMRQAKIGDLLYDALEARFPDWLHRTLTGDVPKKELFFEDNEGKRRCLYFDALELMDNTEIWPEVD